MSALNNSYVQPAYTTGAPVYTTGVPTYGSPVYGGAQVYGGAYTTGVPAYTTGAPVYTTGVQSYGAPVYSAGLPYTTGVQTYGAPVYTTGAPVTTGVVGQPQTRDLVHLNSRLDDILARTKTQGTYVASPNRINTENTLRNSATLRHTLTGPAYSTEPLRRSVVGPTTSILRTESPTLRKSVVDNRSRGVTFANSPLHTGYSQAVVSPLRTSVVGANLGYSTTATHVEPTITYSKVVEPGVVTERQVVEPPVYTTTRHVEEGVETRTILEPSYETRTIVEPTYTTQRIVEQGVATQKVYEPYQVTSTRLVGENLVGGISQVGHSTATLEVPHTAGLTNVATSGYNYRPYETVKSSAAVVSSPTRRYAATASSPVRTTNLATSYVPTTGYASTGYATTGYATSAYPTNLAQSYVPTTGYATTGYATYPNASYVASSPYVGGYTTVGAPYTTVGATQLGYSTVPYGSQVTGTFGGNYVDTGRTVRGGNVGRIENDVESLTNFDEDAKSKKPAAPAANTTATKP